jgi:TonB family protein
MREPRSILIPLPRVALCVVIAFFLCEGGIPAHAQQITTAATTDDLTRGLELYKQGDDKRAIQTLRGVVKKSKNEIAAWYTLALAYTRQGKMGDARKAHEKSAKSGEWLIEQLYSFNPYDSVPAATQRYKAVLLMAAESSKKYLELSSKPSRSKTEEWTERAELLGDYAVLAEESSNNPALTKTYSTREVETKARILSRPEPGYTDLARKNQVTGTIVLRAIFAFDGKVRNIRIVKGLPDGLNLSAIRAARRIKFIPATVNGQPVSQYIQIEYNYNIY